MRRAPCARAAAAACARRTAGRSQWAAARRHSTPGRRPARRYMWRDSRLRCWQSSRRPCGTERTSTHGDTPAYGRNSRQRRPGRATGCHRLRPQRVAAHRLGRLLQLLQLAKQPTAGLSLGLQPGIGILHAQRGCCQLGLQREVRGRSGIAAHQHRPVHLCMPLDNRIGTIALTNSL